MSFGSPYNKSARKVLLLGGGELGKELVIELQRLGIETHVCDNKPHSPAGQVAHYSYHINMLDHDTLYSCIKHINPHCIIPEVESFNMETLKKVGRLDLLPHGDSDSFISMIAENYDEDNCIEVWYINEKKEIRNLLNDADMPCSPLGHYEWGYYRHLEKEPGVFIGDW